MNEEDGKIDRRSGFNSQTKIFHSVRPPPSIGYVHFHLPQEHDLPVSVSDHAFFLWSNSPWRNTDSAAFIDSASGQRVSYSEFIRRFESLASYLQKVTKLSQNDVAFVLASNSTRIPILYFALLSIGVIVSPANPISTEAEISRQIQLSKPTVAFATSSTVHKLPKLKHGTVLIDSPEFDSVMSSSNLKRQIGEHTRAKGKQSDAAAIMYSSGTTGKVKGVMLTHGNLTASLVDSYLSWRQHHNPSSPSVLLMTVPFFHVYGFIYILRSVALGDAMVVLSEGFELKKVLKAIEVYRVTRVALVPPVIVAMAKSGVTGGYDLRSLEGVVCGAAPLSKDVITAFTMKFPQASLMQVSTPPLSTLDGFGEGEVFPGAI